MGARKTKDEIRFRLPDDESVRRAFEGVDSTGNRISMGTTSTIWDSRTHLPGFKNSENFHILRVVGKRHIFLFQLSAMIVYRAENLDS
jgi:hypothetical protein